jgi:polar amino acid transport system ATP-binding protein
MSQASTKMHQRVVLDVQGIRKNYGADEVLRGVSFQVVEGEVLCILGPSGSGKSTLLRCINYLEQPSSGTVRVDRELIGYRLRRGRLHALRPGQIARQRQAIGMVFQHFNLFPHLTVTGNIAAAPMHVLGLDHKAATERAMQALAEVGLTDKAGAYPRQLSGGQQQRVAIARALAMKPRLIMLDEPTSALDPELVGEVLDVMLRLAAEGTTMVVVTHELGFARRAAGAVMLIDGGQVIEQGPAANVLDRPREERTRSFLSKVL